MLRRPCRCPRARRSAPPAAARRSPTAPPRGSGEPSPARQTMAPLVSSLSAAFAPSRLRSRLEPGLGLRRPPGLYPQGPPLGLGGVEGRPGPILPRSCPFFGRSPRLCGYGDAPPVSGLRSPYESRHAAARPNPSRVPHFRSMEAVFGNRKTRLRYRVDTTLNLINPMW